MWMLGAVFSFMAMAIAVRELQRHMGSFEIVFLRSVGMLTVLVRNADGVVSRAAQASLDHLLEGPGGRSLVVKKMMQRAEQLHQGRQSVMPPVRCWK